MTGLANLDRFELPPWRLTIATTELYLHADVDRLGSVLIRKSPLERGRRKKVVPVRPALEQILGELRGLCVPPKADGRTRTDTRLPGLDPRPDRKAGLTKTYILVTFHAAARRRRKCPPGKDLAALIRRFFTLSE